MGNKKEIPRSPRIGVGIIIIRDGTVLLIKRKGVHGTGTWSTPGGHLDYGETPEECAIREAREETGVIIRNVTFKAITNDFFKDEEKHYVTIWMEGRYAGGEVKVNAPYEMSKVGWFLWDELPSPLFLPFQHLLDGECYPRSQSKKEGV